MTPEFVHAKLADLPGPQQVALARVAEEAAELSKEAMKALRFGIENRYPAEGPTNAQKMAAEFSDLQTALVDAGVLRAERPTDADRAYDGPVLLAIGLAGIGDREIAEKLKIPASIDVQVVLDRLKRCGLAKQGRHSRWELTQSGVEACQSMARFGGKAVAPKGL